MFRSRKYKIFDTELINVDELKNFNKNQNLILKFKKNYLSVKKIQKEVKKIMSI